MIRPLGHVLLGLILPAVLAAQQETMTRAIDLERRGNYAAAAEAYRAVLAVKPGDPAALLGLERALLPINRSAEILPQVRAALAANPSSGALYGVALRAWAAADEPDSMRAVAEGWARVAPGDEAPYREWGAAALARQDHVGAAAAYARGRERLRRPDALAAEIALLAIADGDYPTALREWLPTVRRLPGFRPTALASLALAPAPVRPELLQQLRRESDLVARRLEAELRARWGDPVGALETLEPLPADSAVAVEALRGLIEQLRPLPTRDGRETLGRALEALARRSPESQASRLRLEAAQAYSAAGDREAARRMLAGVADDRSAQGTVAAGAAATLVTVLVAEGELDEAARRLTEVEQSLPGDEVAALRRKIVEGWVQAGQLDQADSLLGADSTIDGIALAGKIRLYRGDLAGAIERFKVAGPYAGDRVEATKRTMLLGLLQPIEADSLPALGHAMLQLAQGDTTRALPELEQVAATLPPAKGGAELRLLAGRLAGATGKSDDAERLFLAAATPDAPATAPAAELALAELLLAQDRRADAIPRLEHLILTYPTSALVPQARRTLDAARGAVPRT